MYQGDTRRNEAQPQDGPEKEAEEEICAEGEMKNLRATIQEQEEAILDLTEKLNLEIKLRSESESNAEVLYSEVEYLKTQFKSCKNYLEAQTKLGCDSDKAWQLQFSALEESNKKDKVFESHLRSTIQEKKKAILDLAEKVNLGIKLRSESESNVEVLYSEMECLEDEVESLAKDLDAQTKLGRDSDKAWQLRFSALEESNKKEKSSESNLRPTIQEKEEAILDLTEKLNLQIKLLSESKSNADLLYSEIGYLEDEVKSLAKDLDAQTKRVSDNDKAWKEKMSTLMRERALKEKTIRTAFYTERKALLQKWKEQSCEMHSLQVKCEFQGEQNHEEDFRRLRRQIMNLKDICLRQKKKKLALFGRWMEDREVELERMKRKVPAREPVDSPPLVQCPPPVDPPAPVQCPPPVDPPVPFQCPSPVDPPPTVH